MIPFMFSQLEEIFNQLIRLVFRKDAIDQAGTISKKIKEEWLKNKKNYLEDGLVDVGSQQDIFYSKLKYQLRKNDPSGTTVRR